MAKIRRFYVESILEKNKKIKLTDELKNHIINVLRLKNGDYIRLFDSSSNEFISKLEIRGGEIYAIPFEKHVTGSKPRPEIILCQSLPKLNKMDFVIQKSTELGVNKIIPVVAERSIQKYANLKSKLIRWTKIAQESARQCERIDVPEIEPPVTLQEILKIDFGNAIKLIFDHMAVTTLKNMLITQCVQETVVILVGPEGGFEPSEIELAKECGFIPVRFWNNILRTETAGVIAVGIVRYEWG